MKLNKVLCPFDHSPYSIAANYYASLFADTTKAEIIFLNVAEGAASDTGMEEKLDDLYTELSTKVRPFIHDVRHVYEVRIGDPAKEILKTAVEKHVDLIVMGTHGRTGASHLLHGSVCEKVLQGSCCPVMAVKSDIKIDWMLSESRADAT